MCNRAEFCAEKVISFGLQDVKNLRFIQDKLHPKICLLHFTLYPFLVSLRWQ